MEEYKNNKVNREGSLYDSKFGFSTKVRLSKICSL